MTLSAGFRRCAVLVMAGLLSGCVGTLLGGGKPDSLYRFGASEPVGASGPATSGQQTLLLEKVHFVPEIDGDRMLAVHGGSARYIMGSRWVTSAPSLFTQAIVRSVQTRAPGLRVTTIQNGAMRGYAMAVTITRFEARYDDASMTGPPTIAIEGDIALYGLSDRQVVMQRHVISHAAARQNHVEDIATAFDQATMLFTADLTDWVQSVTMSRDGK